ncbi:hypothetical protein [Pseudobutyrivibrio sp.]|uniref:DUF7211 domain-containing protein n=1 Tax=Pseudobutyrivibrio sp. TaxID=2014367 RepID=UPI003869A47B
MSELYLAHHGIKGQRWGVRRFQDKHGQWTEEGRKRYSENGFEFRNPKLEAQRKVYRGNMYDKKQGKELSADQKIFNQEYKANRSFEIGSLAAIEFGGLVAIQSVLNLTGHSEFISLNDAIIASGAAATAFAIDALGHKSAASIMKANKIKADAILESAKK